MKGHLAKLCTLRYSLDRVLSYILKVYGSLNLGNDLLAKGYADTLYEGIHK